MNKPLEKLEFEPDSLYYSTIEDEITRFYDLGYADSSNFMEIDLGVHSGYYIMATKGIIEFSAIVGKAKDNKYIVTINPYKIKKNK